MLGAITCATQTNGVNKHSMKHPNILAARIAAAPFYTPPPAYGEAAEAVPALDEANIIPQVGALAGDVGPDFTELDKKFGGAPEPEVIKAADPTAILPETPAIPQEPDKPAAPVEKPPESPDKPAEPAKASEVKPTDAAKPEFDADAAAKKLEELAINPKASASTKEGFQNLKTITAEAVTTVKTLREKIADLEKRGGMTPEVEAELKTLREFKDTWGVEHDPEFLKPFNEKLTAAEEGFIKTLTEDQEIGLLKTDAEAQAAGIFADAAKTIPLSAETIKRVGLDSPEGQKITARILGVLRGNDNPMLYEKAMDGIRARKAVVAERDARINEVKEKQGGYVKSLEAREQAERSEYGNGFNAKMIELVKGVPWLVKKEIAADATPEAKALAAQHNAWIEKDFVEQIRSKLGPIYTRDPQVTAETIYKSVAYDQVTKERDALAAAKTQLEARVAELQKTAAGVRQVSAAPTRQSGAPVTPGKEPPKLNQTAEEALDDFLATKK